MKRVIMWGVLATLVVSAGTARADLVGNYQVGSGSNASFVQIQFGNANTYLYEVRYDGSRTGKDLFDSIAAAQPGFFSYEVVTYSFGDALLGVSIGSDSNAGFGTPPAYLDYWHYWTRATDGEAWTESFIGFGDRVVANGSWDGWVFDSAAAPNAIPAPGALALLLFGATARGRRR